MGKYNIQLLPSQNNVNYATIDNGMEIIAIIPKCTSQELHSRMITDALNNTFSKSINPESVSDMLEALKECKDFINSYFESDDSFTRPIAKSLLVTITAAIKKAEQ